MSRANYEFIGNNDDFVLLRDMGPWDRSMTITNDAENVVADLLQSETVKAGIRLFYIDSEGDYTELEHDGRRFTGFRHVEQDMAMKFNRMRGLL